MSGNPPLRGPTFLVIGAQKCATTWLHKMLAQHPEVGVPKAKELDFFDRADNYSRGIDSYLLQFRELQGKRAIGECTPSYLWTAVDPCEIPGISRTHDVPALVRDHLPDVNLIISLRDPVERAISAYYHHIRARRISPRTPLKNCQGLFGIASVGHYAIHLSNWLKHFPARQMLILIYEEDLSDEKKPETLERIFAHIGVDVRFCPEGIFDRHYSRATMFDLRAARLPDGARRLIRALMPERLLHSGIWGVGANEAEVAALRAYFRPHNRALENLLGRVLPW